MPTKRHFWRSGVANLIVQIFVLSGAWIFIPNALIPSSGFTRYLLLILLVCIPSIVWALFFYVQDKKTPEPLPALFHAFWLGISSAVILFIPLTQYVFRLQDWLFSDMKLFLLGSLFIYSPIIVILFYIILRIVFFPMSDLDEPIDGMVYGSFIGAGFACAKSIVQLAGTGDYTVFYGLYTASVHTILFASLGACIGYFIGKSKFEKKLIEKNTVFALVFGILIVTVYQFINEYILLSGIAHAYEFSFILSAVYGLLILAWCYSEMRRLAKKSDFKHSKAHVGIERSAIGIIVATATIATMITVFALRDKTFENDLLRFEYSSQFTTFTSFGAVTYSAEGKVLFSASDDKTSFVCIQASSDDPVAGEPLSPLLNSLRVTSGSLQSLHTKRYEYAYIKENDNTLPDLYWVRHDVIQVEKNVFIFVYSTLPQKYDEDLPRYEKMLQSVSIGAEGGK